ncbi:VP7 [Fall chinook aquareovirus]|uniref:VP7 n=1 Tax=Fall chinook aquareovirus TaxID=1963254 RepID=UPI0009951FDB|nr:VP7 [Fall chinook aquareovirus]AQU42735.1 VP7 [Fall chinook aquareovirus]
MDIKPLHPTVANALCDALTTGNLQGSHVDGPWSSDTKCPDIIATGQYQVCTGCFRMVSSVMSDRGRVYLHTCNPDADQRHAGAKLAENLLTIAANIRMSVSDAIIAMRGRTEPSLQQAMSRQCQGLRPEYSFSELATVMNKVRHDSAVAAPTVSLDKLASPINVKRTLAFYGKDLRNHPLVEGTPLKSELEEMTGGNRARDGLTGNAVVQLSGMVVPVMFNAELEMITPILSTSNRAVLIEAMLTHSCAMTTSQQRVRAYGKKGAKVSELAVECENRHGSNRCHRRCKAVLITSVDEADP